MAWLNSAFRLVFGEMEKRRRVSTDRGEHETCLLACLFPVISG